MQLQVITSLLKSSSSLSSSSSSSSSFTIRPGIHKVNGIHYDFMLTIIIWTSRQAAIFLWKKELDSLSVWATHCMIWVFFFLQDMVYKLFYHDGDYPVLKFLKQPLYFEVGMDHSRDYRLAVRLENCWATLTKDRESTPRWDLIVDGYVKSIVCVCWTFSSWRVL